VRLLQNDYFQDDLFPPTKVLWEPAMTASQWFGGANIPPKRMDLKPNDMETRKSFDFGHQISPAKPPPTINTHLYAYFSASRVV
jgi:coronin-7